MTEVKVHKRLVIGRFNGDEFQKCLALESDKGKVLMSLTWLPLDDGESMTILFDGLEWYVRRDGPCRYTVSNLIGKTWCHVGWGGGLSAHHVVVGTDIEMNGDSYTGMDEASACAITAVITVFRANVIRRGLIPFTCTVKGIGGIKSPAKKRKAMTNHNTVVYLGKPPQGAYGNGDGKPLEFGYPRTSHYRTLSHERYKKHPKYMVSDGVWVKQAWCGPEEYRVKTRTYKLWEPSDIDATN